MRPIILTSLILALTGSAYAQQPAAPATPGTLPGRGQGAPGTAMAGAETRDALLQAAPATAAPAPAGPQRPPRSDKAIGPDLIAYVFAPIGAIVNPVARDLHGVDAALDPISEFLLPITGPLDPDLFQPAGEVPPAAAMTEPVRPPQASPVRAGRRNK